MTAVTGMIIFDGIIFSSGNRLGGVSVYFRELIRQAVLAAEELRVLVHDAGFGAAELQCRPEQVWFRAPRKLERFRSLAGIPDGLLHSSYYRTTAQQSVRNVVTVYDFTYERFLRGPRAFLHAQQKRKAILRADAVICISHNTQRDLHHFIPKCPPEKVFVTHLAAGDHFKPLESVKITLTSKPYVLFVGGRSDYKNFATAVQALALVDEIALVCVGGGPFSAQESAMLEAALPGRYFHAGPVKATDLNDFYNGAVCLLYPSLYEGFGIPPLEAMQAGCPFVALNRSSVPEVAGDAGILLDESAPRLIADAIVRCTGAETRAMLRARGLQQARKFSWRKTFDETLAIYRRLQERR